MSPLRQSLADYLQIRRPLGYKLERAEKLLVQYLDYLDTVGAEKVTIENALAWATLPAAGRNGHWWAFRLSVVRGFARYLHALDDRHEVPPADLLPSRARRSVPYLYSPQEIVALMDATSALRFALRQATYRTLIGLLWVTGMRVGEAIRLDRQAVDLRHAVLTVRNIVRQIPRAAGARLDRRRAALLSAAARAPVPGAGHRRGADLPSRPFMDDIDGMCNDTHPRSVRLDV